MILKKSFPEIKIKIIHKICEDKTLMLPGSLINIKMNSNNKTYNSTLGFFNRTNWPALLFLKDKMT